MKVIAITLIFQCSKDEITICQDDGNLWLLDDGVVAMRRVCVCDIQGCL